MQWLHLCVPGTMCEDLLLWFEIAETAAHTSLGISVCQRCACRQCFLPMNASEVRWRPIVRAVVFCVCKLFHAVRTGFKKECGARTAFFSFACGGTCAGVLRNAPVLGKKHHWSHAGVFSFGAGGVAPSNCPCSLTNV
jgi:hypothetical protein